MTLFASASSPVRMLEITSDAAFAVLCTPMENAMTEEVRRATTAMRMMNLKFHIPFSNSRSALPAIVCLSNPVKLLLPLVRIGCLRLPPAEDVLHHFLRLGLGDELDGIPHRDIALEHLDVLLPGEGLHLLDHQHHLVAQVMQLAAQLADVGRP